MRFCDVSEVPEKPVFTRLFDLFASAVLANFQDRLVMTASWLIGASRYNPPYMNCRQADIIGYSIF